MTTKHKNQQLLCLLISLLLSFSGCTVNSEVINIPSPSKGIIDFSDLPVSQMERIPLSGQWEFYWNDFFEPEDFKSGEIPSPGYIDVPSIWNDPSQGEGSYSPSGYGTYRLQIIVSDSSQIYALNMREVCSSYNLWVNGRLIHAAGNPGRDAAETIPGYNSHTSPFSIKSNTIEIVIQIANFHYKDGGIRDKIFFGTAKSMLRKHNFNLVVNYILFGSLLIMALYHFALFGLQRKNKAPLLFGLFCLIMTSRILVTNEMLISELIPSFSWNWHLRTIVLGYFAGFPLFFAFLRQMFPENISRRISLFIMFTGGTASLIVLFSPPLFFSRIEALYQLFIIIWTLYLIYSLLRAAFNKRDGAWQVLVGLMVLFLTVINDILYAQNMVVLSLVQSLVPLGVFLFIFIQSYILSVRFSNAFTIANTDALTQIANRRHFLDIAENTFQESVASNHDLCMMFLDIDHFKRINDAYGHDAGDEVLKSFASTVNKLLGSSDIWGRMGGEEFALLTKRSPENVGYLAESIRKSIEEMEVTVGKQILKITVSIGISTTRKEGNISLKKLSIQADKALYSAKKQGRNRFIYENE